MCPYGTLAYLHVLVSKSGADHDIGNARCFSIYVRHILSTMTWVTHCISGVGIACRSEQYELPYSVNLHMLS